MVRRSGISCLAILVTMPRNLPIESANRPLDMRHSDARGIFPVAMEDGQ